VASKRDNLFDFFDPSKARGGRKGPDVGKDVTGQFSDTPSAAPEPAAESAESAEAGPMTVSRLVARIKRALADAMPRRVTVVGELSNVKRHDSGHIYFRLKDASAALDAVMWRSAAGRLKFDPADGLEVVAEGRVDVYDVRGQLQLYIERMTPRGAGSLELAFRQLKQKLEAEGLFDPVAKKPLPRFPRAVGVITSPTGAAVRDIARTLRRRWPAANVYVLATLVQGEGAAEQIAARIAAMDAAAGRLGIDTIVVARGGGSLEDLWAFNEEPVARAVFAAGTPIVSGVGHETDVTICDLVADVRAATPTAAAELAVPDGAALRQQLSESAERARRRIRQRLDESCRALEALTRSAAIRDPVGPVRVHAQRIDELAHRLRGSLMHRAGQARKGADAQAARLAALHPAHLRDRAVADIDRLLARLRWALGARSKRAGEAVASASARLVAASPAHRLRLARQEVAAAARQLEAMSYRRILRRGFSVTRGASGAILRSTAEAAGGEIIETELADGRLTSRVTGDSERSRRRRKPTPDGPGLFE